MCLRISASREFSPRWAKKSVSERRDQNSEAGICKKDLLYSSFSPSFPLFFSANTPQLIFPGYIHIFIAVEDVRHTHIKPRVHVAKFLEAMGIKCQLESNINTTTTLVINLSKIVKLVKVRQWIPIELLIPVFAENRIMRWRSIIYPKRLQQSLSAYPRFSTRTSLWNKLRQRETNC